MNHLNEMVSSTRSVSHIEKKKLPQIPEEEVARQMIEYQDLSDFTRGVIVEAHEMDLSNSRIKTKFGF